MSGNATSPPRRQTTRTERVGRFQLTWDGRQLAVIDTTTRDQIRAKVTEWRELAAVIDRGAAAR